jgi:hypothetical protein
MKRAGRKTAVRRVQVLCPECGGDVSPLREFCPKCGTPTDPGLRERRKRLVGGGPAEPDLRRNRKRVFLIAAGAMAVALVAGSGNWIDWDSDERPSIPHREEAKGPITVDAEDLYTAFRDDPDAAEQRFEGREMVVTGEFVRIVPDGYGSLDLRLKTSNPAEQLGIDVANIAIEDAKKLRPGQRVTVSCQELGRGGDELWVRECAIQPNAEEGASAKANGPASPPAPPPAPAPEKAE